MSRRGGTRGPGPASVSPVPAVPPAPSGAGPATPPTAPERAEPSEPQPCELLARFATAAGALAFSEQAMQAAQLDSVTCYQADGGASWWVAARLTLGTAREMAGLGAGRLYTRTASGFVQDRGWGDEPGPGPAAELPDLVPAELLDLVRVAGLHRVPDRPLREACVLVPGYLVHKILERALDLRLRATYQRALLDPLFEAARPRRTCYGVWLTVGPGQENLPSTLLATLRDDPFTLVCRPMEQALLIGYGTASPLSDRMLAHLAAAAGGGTWLLAGPPDACARLTWDGEPLDAGTLVRLGPAHALTDLDESVPYAEPADQASFPGPRPLTVIPGARATVVDAVLLDDADLKCLPLLLAGDPLADIAFLVRGAARHLLTAPGGLLTELPVGEPLSCVGPGSVYLPTGWRLDPPVGPAARAALFQPDGQTAQVLLRDARLGYRLDAAEPLWQLWAGPVPDLDTQLPRSALADLEQAAREIGEPAQVPDRPRTLFGRRRAPQQAEPADASAWRRDAHQAELARDYVAAAQLYTRHNEPLRAARMWEREAEEKY